MIRRKILAGFGILSKEQKGYKMKVVKKLTIIVLVSMLFTVSAFAQMQYRRYYDFTRGLNDKAMNIFIKDNEASKLQNVMFIETGAIAKRTGYEKLISTAVNDGVAITGLYNFWKADGSTSYVITTSTSYIKKLNSAGDGWDVLCSTASATSTDYYDFCSHQDYCIIVDNKSVPKKYLSGAATTDIGTGTDPDDWRPNTAKYCQSWDYRLWFANVVDADAGVTQTTNRNRVRYSSALGSTAFEGAEAYPPVQYFDIDDSEITGLAILGPRLTVFGPDSITIVAGDETSYVINYYVKKIVEGTGCVSNNTIVNVENELFFMDESGHIYAFNGGRIRLLSDKISTTINGLNKSVLYKACAVVYPKYTQVWFSVADGTSTTNNLILVYNYKLNSWTKYSGINAAVMALVKVNSVEYVYTGDATTDSFIFKQDTGNNDNGTAIDAYFTTKSFGDDLIEHNKKFDSMYLYVKQSGDYDITVQYDVDFGQATKTTLVNIASDAPIWGQFVWGDFTWGGRTVILESIRIDQQGNFINFTFANDVINETFTIYGFTLLYEPYPLR